VRHPLDGKEIRGHLSVGKHPTRLALTWNDRVSFVLTDKMHAKRLEFLELAKDEAEGGDGDPVERFDAEFAVMAGELGGLLQDLVQALGSDASAVTDWRARVKVA
jgi:recombination associated protein RdgC